MINYEANIREFYSRADYATLVGRQGSQPQDVEFGKLTYAPRKTTPLPGLMAGSVLKEFAATAGGSALYVHIPFCNLRCSYCSFYRNPFAAEQVEAYVAALVQELELLEAQGVFAEHKLEAVFFGGGTPSVLSAAQIERVLTTLHQKARLADDCELTFESSIYDLDADKLAACLAGGINRFSFGVQSFDTKLRRSLGRLNTQAEVMARLKQVALTPARVIIDLIYGLIGQTEELLVQDIDLALDCGISGLDLYKLQIMPKSPLGQAIANCKINYDHSNAALAAMFLTAAERLEQRSARPLSCCHWALRADEVSRYNSLVKQGSSNIAVGCGCGGRMGAYSFMKAMTLSSYLEQLQAGKYPVMILGKQGGDYAFLHQLSGQCDRGCLDFAALRRWHLADWELLLAQLLEHWQELGLLTSDNERYHFTSKGKFYYRQLDRVLLTAAEYALYGKTGLLEQAEQKLLGGMKNMQ